MLRGTAFPTGLMSIALLKIKDARMNNPLPNSIAHSTNCYAKPLGIAVRPTIICCFGRQSGQYNGLVLPIV